MGIGQPNQIFSHPENDTHVMSTWERFLSGENLWLRCASSLDR